MTDRIRPEDLRAIMAAIAGQGTPASDLPKEMGWAQAAIMMADELLAELARTAKPEMAAPRLHACHDCQQAEAEADARAEAAEARLVEAGEHIVASDATIARLNAEMSEAMERAQKAEARVNQLLGRHESAARAKRERIISLLADNLYFPVVGCRFYPGAQSVEGMVGEILLAEELRATLTPPVQP